MTARPSADSSGASTVEGAPSGHDKEPDRQVRGRDERRGVRPPRERTRVLRIIARLNVGGPAIHATLLSEQLDPSRYESLLIAGAEEPTEGRYLDLHPRDASLPLRYLPELGREIRGANDLSALRAIGHVIDEFQPHIVHTHTAKAGTLGRIAAWRRRVPVVVHTYHGHVLHGYFSPAKTALFVAIERFLAARSSCLVTVTPRVRQELLARGIGRPDRFDVVPLGFDLDRFARADSLRGELRRELHAARAPMAVVTSAAAADTRGTNPPASAADTIAPIGPTTPLIGIVARLVPIKAHELFFAMAARVAAAHPDARFVVVGDGERRGELEALAARLGLAARTHFLGWRGDLDRLYADLDVVVLTSRNEGSPVALIEGMASARPVVSTRVGGVADVVAHEETGLLAEPGDAAGLAAAVSRLIDDPALAARMGREGRARVLSTFSSTRLLQDVDALYQRLLAERGLA